MSDDDAQPLHRGSGGSTYTRKAHATREAPKRGRDRDDRTNWTPVRDRPGALGWRRGSQYRGNRVTLAEGRDLSSRQTQNVAKDMEIGQPINSK
jgi:hypothetical protein